MTTKIARRFLIRVRIGVDFNTCSLGGRSTSFLAPILSRLLIAMLLATWHGHVIEFGHRACNVEVDVDWPFLSFPMMFVEVVQLKRFLVLQFVLNFKLFIPFLAIFVGPFGLLLVSHTSVIMTL